MIAGLVVSGKHRRHGVGRVLVERAEGVGQGAGLFNRPPLVELDPNRDAPVL